MSIRGNRLILIAIAAFAISALTACGTSSSPTATPEPSPTATPVPVTASITIDPSADPVAFLNALPQTEVACASSAVGGQDKLVRLVGMAEGNTDGITQVQLRVMASCISDRTVASIAIGQLELQTGGLSSPTKTCINQYTASIDFTSFFDTGSADPESFVASLQAMFCLNDEERAAFNTSTSPIVDFSEIGGIEALECVVDASGPTGLEDLALYFSDSSASIALSGQFVPIMIDCGLMTDADFQDSGLTAAEISCLFGNVDGAAIETFMEISVDSTAVPDLATIGSIMLAMTSCGIDAEALLGQYLSDDETPGLDTTQVPTVSTETLLCLSDNGVSADLVTDYLTGQADPDEPTLAAALAICAGDNEGEGVVIPDGNGGTTTLDPSVVESLPFTIEQIQCIVDEVGVEQLEALANGSANPLALLGALGACDISLSDLAEL